MGIPKIIFIALIAIFIFMTGDGIEQAFLSKNIVDIGFSGGQASLVFTVYGVMVVVGSWLAAVLSDVYGPRKIMALGTIIWLIFHVLFLVFGIGMENLPMMLVLYGIRGLGYPLFLYGFLVWVTYITDKARLATAIGWFWAMFSVGMGVIGTYLPSFTIPFIGFNGTLWMSLIWIFIGCLIAFIVVGKRDVKPNITLSVKQRYTKVLKDIGVVYKNPEIIKVFIVRIINQLSLFGLVIIFPVLFTETIGFSMQQWLWTWGTMHVTCIVGDVVWGIIADKIGWKRQVMLFGCIGCGITTLLFYYLPILSGDVFAIAILCAVLFGITQSAFVPIFAIFTALEPDHIGATLSSHNLAAGLSNFIAPLIATLILPLFNEVGVVWAFAICYFVGAAITYYIKVHQPGIGDDKVEALNAQIENY
ncbi:MFS transporter [Staphylococcus ureilyticus]|nr:MFS transporter [Staphylococcus sp. S75]MBL0383252.1 MFS transporter [Staphylococcus sp. S59]MBL0400818.1 MFS transporter [Staphylococcus sp. S36]OJT34195.1 MFS transporter [Staphylococcus ureilyticus]QKU19633.1 MFS transporter [Staphylococcus cohnii]RXZ29204.1 MFS transporter [Staphylococcus sp. SNAZ 59]RXZ37492.1 MFS transporter [Staphylococcus sp. SNAZ 36]RXZ41937.1 MFS transporter [Staphylococcus sp. SNAZ 75]